MLSYPSRGRLSLLALAFGLTVVVPIAIPSLALARDGSPHQRGSGTATDAWLVGLRHDVTDAAAAALLSGAGAQELGSLADLDVRVIDIPFGQRSQTLARLKGDSRVVSLEQDATASAGRLPADPNWTKQWGARTIGAPAAWDVSIGKASSIIAIVDTGVDASQPDLRGRVLPGWDFHNNDANPADDNGHGTAVAGVAAADGNNGLGIAGLCWLCRILPVKVLNANGSGSHSNIAAGIVWATDHGADVINLSIAGTGSTTALWGAVNYARTKGVVVVGAAGNQSSTRKYYPAAYPGVLSVGASKANDDLYGWSNRGSWISLAAPGCAFTSKPRNAWSWWCGTSFATPAVAGTAALMKSVRPRTSGAQIEATLLSTAIRVNKATYRRLDAARAVRAVAGGSFGQPPDTSPTPTPRPTPTPTPRPSATPTPTPTPTPRAGEDHEWRGTLSWNDSRDDEWFWLSGHVHVEVTWSGDEELWISVKDDSGRSVAHESEDEHIYFELDVRQGWYRFSVGQWADSWTEYLVRIEHPH